jgi:hypothetical protein
MLSGPLLCDFVSFSLIILCAIATLAGFGFITARFLKLEILNFRIEQIWLGLAVLLTLVELIHFFTPINSTVSFIIFTIGISLLSIQLRKNVTFILNSIKNNKDLYLKILLFIAFFIAFCFCALKAMESPTNYDSGLYHFTSIRWIEEEPLIAGLGNLHDRLAFNQSWFGLVAILNIFPFFQKGYAVAGMIIIILGVAQIFLSSSKKGYLGLFYPVLLFSILFNLKQISSPSPDIAVNLVTVVITILMAELLSYKQNINLDQQKKFLLITIAALCVALATIKLSGAVFAFSALITSIYIFKPTNTYNSYKFILFVLGICALLYSPHFIRGIYLSGAPFFPSSFGYSEQQWSMNPDVIKETLNWVYCWARSPGPECLNALDNWSWLYIWWKKLPKDLAFIFTAGTILFLSPLFIRKHFSHNKARLLSAYIICIPPALSMIIWFFTAPDPRFLYGISYIFLAIGFLVLSGLSKKHQKQNSIQFIKKDINILIFILLVGSYQFTKISSENLDKILNNGFQPIKSIQILERSTKSGLKIYMPKTGDQCFDSPLPCTPYFNESLKLVIEPDSYPLKYFSVN